MSVFLCADRFFQWRKKFFQDFGITYIIWTIVDWYDAIVIDWIWFCLDPRFVIPGTEDMTKTYHDYWFHTKASLRNMLIGLSDLFYLYFERLRKTFLS